MNSQAAATASSIETLNLEVTGTNTIGTLTNAAMQTLNISGAGSLKAVLAATTNKLAAIESTALGSVDLDLSTSGVLKASGKYSVKTGAGGDTIILAQADFLKDAKIDLGDGLNTVVVKTSGAIAPTKDMLSSLTNVDELGFTGANDVVLKVITGAGVNILFYPFRETNKNLC